MNTNKKQKESETDDQVIERLERFYSNVDWQAHEDAIAEAFKTKPVSARNESEAA